MVTKRVCYRNCQTWSSVYQRGPKFAKRCQAWQIFFSKIIKLCQMLARMMWQIVFKFRNNFTHYLQHMLAMFCFTMTLFNFVACRTSSQDVCEIFEFGAVQKCVDLVDLEKCRKRNILLFSKLVGKNRLRYSRERALRNSTSAYLLIVTMPGFGMRIT